MSVHISSEIWRTRFTSPKAKLVALAIADMVNDQGYGSPSIESIAARCDMTPDDVNNVIVRFKGSGLIRYEEGFMVIAGGRPE
jgi:DNA-directed RNA polymerase specialized sigma54-like protein